MLSPGSSGTSHQNGSWNDTMTGRTHWMKQPRGRNGRWKKKPAEKEKPVRRFLSFRRKMSSSAATLRRRGNKKVRNRRLKEAEVGIVRAKVLSDSGRDPAYVARKYDKFIRDGFTKREVGLMEKAGGIDLVVVNHLPKDEIARTEIDEDGRFIVKVLPQELRNKETLIHETVHILQCIDPKRPKKEKEIVKKSTTNKDLEALNEALVEAESLSRVDKLSIDQNGYYEYLRGIGEPYDLKEQDHELLRRPETVRKGSYQKDTFDRFDDTNIKELSLDGSAKAIDTKNRIMPKKDSKGGERK